MKRILLIAALAFIGCSTDDTEVNRDLVVLHSTTFASEPYEVEKEDVMGVEFEGTETRINVIKFNENGRVTYFKVDDYGEVQPGTRSTTGAYKVSFPEIYDIVAVHIFSEESVTIQQANNIMYFNAGGLRYTSTLEY